MIIKPDAVAKRLTGKILQRVSQEGFRVCAVKPERLTAEIAGEFYRVHRNKPFYRGLVDFMVSGPIVAIVLEKEDAVGDLRKLIGATNPREAEEGTIRREYAEDGRKNAVHASDSLETAREEIDFFFQSAELS